MLLTSPGGGRQARLAQSCENLRENVGSQLPSLYQSRISNHSPCLRSLPQRPSICAVFSRNLFSESSAKLANAASRERIFSKPVCYAI
jgi:hypothetical protein